MKITQSEEQKEKKEIEKNKQKRIIEGTSHKTSSILILTLWGSQKDKRLSATEKLFKIITKNSYFEEGNRHVGPGITDI